MIKYIISIFKKLALSFGYTFWRTRKAIALILIMLSRAKTLIHQEFKNILFHLKLTKNKREILDYSKQVILSKEKPIIFVSVCEDIINAGGPKYNGGIKELNNLVKLLRSKGYESYIVTYDGNFENWLIDHQAHISLPDFKDMIVKTKNYRCITSWIIAEAFLKECQEFYFWDMELAATNNKHFHKLSKYMRSKRLKNVAGISRTIQAWYMTSFQKNCYVIPNLIDRTIWFPEPLQRIENRIGYMHEGEHTDLFVKKIESITKKSNLNLEFIKLSGDEKKILDLMRTCNIYLSLNIGKDELFGEGCPRTIIESMAAGCINISFDLIGNKEVVINNYTGFIVNNKTTNSMGEMLCKLYKENNFEYYRSNVKSLFDKVHNFESRWSSVKSFLQL
ncbi:glycosyltransferase [Candidatus Neomarinimicrobiota bacterium]